MDTLRWFFNDEVARVYSVSREGILRDKGMISPDVSNHNPIQKYTDSKVEVPDTVVQHRIFGHPKGFALESIRDAANTSIAILAIMESAKTRMPVEVTYG